MRAARFHGEGRITVELAEPPCPAEGEVRLRVLACALCGSDLRPRRLGWPATPGHEIAGRVEQPGHAWDGRRALVYIPVFCGHCPECAQGWTNLCRNATDLVGWQRPGGYAEALAVPERCLLPVPDDVPDHLAPLLLDTVGTAAHGIRLAQRVVAGGSALVLGAGPIGLGAILVLRRMGFTPVSVIEPGEHRAKFAASLGAERLTPAEVGRRRYDLVIEASGKDTARQIGLEAVTPMGAMVQLGEADAWQVAETKAVRRKDFFLIRSFYFPRGDHDASIALLRADFSDYARLVDASCGLDGLETLFDEFARGERLKPALVLP